VTETTAAIDAGRQEARPHELRKVVTVLFVDVSGPTALGDPLDTLAGLYPSVFDANVPPGGVQDLAARRRSDRRYRR